MFHKRELPTFNYIPRFYDPEKEALEQKKAAMGLESQLSEEEKLRVKMRRTWGRLDESGRPTKPKASFSKIRTIVILGVAVFFVYVLFFTPFVENFINVFLRMGGK